VVRMEVTGLPVHPLVVHLVVFLVPLAALSAWAMALLPRWRWLSRWVALASGSGALLAVVVARQSGESLLEDRPFLTSAASKARYLLETHQERAGQLLWATIALLVLVAAAFLVLPAPTGLANGRLDHPGSGSSTVWRVLTVLLLVVGLGALVLVVLTGDAGARAVWSD
jgi:hypothetical protein